MAKKKESYLVVEAKRLGFKKMLSDIEKLMQTNLSDAQKIALQDQQTKIRELLDAL